MKKITLVLLLLAGTAALGQTKKISYKSHSGSPENFSVALEENLFDMDNSNFGMAPQRNVVNAQLDSVIFISDSVAIMVTSEYCVKEDTRTNKPISDPKLWSAGRATVINHPLFSKNHSLDSIRQVLKQQYNFQNPVEKVVFVGYDNQKNKYRRGELIPVINHDNDQSPFDGQFFLIISLVVGLALLAALISWRFYKTPVTV